MEERDISDARMRYHFALAPEDHERVPFYSALLKELELDNIALELLASVRVEQRNPMLVLAILHYHALCGHDMLGPIFASAREGGLEEPTLAAAQVLSILRSNPELVRNELWRSTQTNEPGRSAVLQAVVRDASRGEGSIDIVEVGTSAGINLWFDHFPVMSRDDGHPLTLTCDDRSPVDRTTPLPEIRRRVGIDPHPLDLSNIDDCRWLKACIWPEERRRHERLDAIIETQGSWPRRDIVAGTAHEQLQHAMVRASEEQLTVVFNTWVLFYLSDEERDEYLSEMARRCRGDNVAWISIESTLIPFPGLDVDPAAHHRGASQIVLTLPGRPSVLWGWCHAHGRWIERPEA